MISADQANGLFEAIGGCMVFMHSLAAYKVKKVAGVSRFATVVFTSWGYYNLFYYPHLDQWYSFAGGLVIVAGNMTWLYMMWLYRNAPKEKPGS